MSFPIRLAAVAAAVLALLAPAQGSERAHVKIDGIGAAACADVSARYEGGGAFVVGEALLQWTYGYLSRRNVERELKGEPAVDLAVATNEDKLLNIIVKTCRDKPDLRVFQVVDALYEVLLEKGALTS